MKKLGAKRSRALGGCLGARSRRRARRAAKRGWGAASERRAIRTRMGQPTICHRVVARSEEHRVVSGTAGTETSQYREERKSNETPGVAASETGSAQTVRAPRGGRAGL